MIQRKEHHLFTCEGPHLFLKKRITLNEAICGFEFPICHLDNRILVVKSGSNVVYKPGDSKVIRGEGMPLFANPGQRGHLYIEFEVEFPKPESMDDAMIEVCRSYSYSYLDGTAWDGMGWDGVEFQIAHPNTDIEDLAPCAREKRASL